MDLYRPITRLTPDPRNPLRLIEETVDYELVVRDGVALVRLDAGDLLLQRPPRKELCHEDGSLQEFLLTMDGKRFRCDCGCNVFHKFKGEPDTFYCNCCPLGYETTKGESHAT